MEATPALDARPADVQSAIHVDWYWSGYHSRPVYKHMYAPKCETPITRKTVWTISTKGWVITPPNAADLSQDGPPSTGRSWTCLAKLHSAKQCQANQHANQSQRRWRPTCNEASEKFTLRTSGDLQHHQSLDRKEICQLTD